MMTHKKLPGFSAALLLAVSMGSVYAADGDMTQTRTQERIRTEVNLQTPENEMAQSRIREQKMVQNQSQIRIEARNNFQTRQSNAASGSKTRQNMTNRGIR